MPLQVPVLTRTATTNCRCYATYQKKKQLYLCQCLLHYFL